MNFVPCLTWVAKGIAKSCPDKLLLTPDELKNLIQETNDLPNKIENNSEEVSDEDDEDVDEETENSEIASEKAEENEDFETKYNLNSYDDDEDKDEPFMKFSKVTSFIDNKEDNYITDYDAVEDDEKEDEEDFIIKENDNLLLVGHIEEESSVLEVYVHNKEDDALYVHHDIVLPAYPLALEWLDFHPSDEEKGNYVAVGDMTSMIKVWDLDVVDILEPEYCLGKELKEKKMEKIKLKYHTDAVLSLSWNKHVRNVLASGSADSSIIIWNLEEAKPMNKLEFHSNKVQSLQWHPFESSFLLSGCTDGVVKLFDCRTPDSECKSWKFDGEIEKVAWNLSNPMKFLCSTDQGFVNCIDMRTNEIEHSIKAHTDAVTGLDMCPTKPNILVTASMDKTIKIWDLQKLSHIQTQKLKVGSIYTAKFAPDSELVLAIGGNNRSNSLKVMDLGEKLNIAGENKTEKNEEHSNVKSEGKKNFSSGKKEFTHNAQRRLAEKRNKFKKPIKSEPSTSYNNSKKFSKTANSSQISSHNLEKDFNASNVTSEFKKDQVKTKSHVIYSDDETSQHNEQDSKRPPIKRIKTKNTDV